MVLMFTIAGSAQDTPQMETFVGYTYVRASSTSKFPAYSANGRGGQFAYNFNHYVSTVADIGAVHNNNIGGNRIDNTAADFLVRPTHFFSVSAYPALCSSCCFGGVYVAASSELSAIVVDIPAPGQRITVRATTQQAAFAMAAGGGLDIKINEHVSFRPIGLDYYLTRLQNLRKQEDNSQNNLR